MSPAAVLSHDVANQAVLRAADDLFYAWGVHGVGSVAAAQRMLDDVGLTGPFWQLTP